MKSNWPLLVALFVGVIFGIYTTTPPSPLPADAPTTDFSATRAMSDIRVIAEKPHPTGSLENARVRTYLLDRMASMGMETRTDLAPLPVGPLKRLNTWSGQKDQQQTFTNVIGILPGRDRSLPAVMLMSHHDTVWGSPGAADDTTGVAVSLEVVRAINARGLADRDLILLATDAEELGLVGAQHFFVNDTLRNRVGAIINLEARGGGGRTNMFQTSRDNGSAMALYAASVRQPAASSLAAFIYSVLPNDTDLTPALKGDFTAFNFAFIGRSGHYHSPLSTADRLDQGSVQDMGGQTLDLAAALLKQDSMPAKSPDSVFFDVLGEITIHYPVWMGWLFLGIACIAFAISLRRDGIGGFGGGIVRFFILVVVAGLLVIALNWLSLGGGQGEYYDRLAAIPRLEAMAGLACLAAFAAIVGPWRTSTGGMAGFAFPLVLLACAGQIFAPTANYFVTLPIMLVALILALPVGLLRGLAQIAVCATVLGYMLGLGHFVMQGVGPTMPAAAILPFTLATLTVLPLWHGMSERNTRLVAGLATACALGLSLWVLLDAPAETVAVYA